MSDAPLSDLIATIRERGDQQLLPQLIELLRRSPIGVVASPGGVGTVVTGPEHSAGFAATEDGSGHHVLLAFADPEVFVRNYGHKFNAKVSGDDLIRTALFNPDCHGIRINSALAQTSLILSRETLTSIPGPDQRARPHRPWWKFLSR